MAGNYKTGIYSCIKMLKLHIKIKRNKSRVIRGIFGFVKGGALT